MVRFNAHLAPTLRPPRPPPLPPTRFLVREQVLDANAYELSVEPRLTDHFLRASEELGSGPAEPAAQSDAPTPDRASDEATPVRDDLRDADLPIPDPADDVDALEELEEERRWCMAPDSDASLRNSPRSGAAPDEVPEAQPIQVRQVPIPDSQLA